MYQTYTVEIKTNHLFNSFLLLVPCQSIHKCNLSTIANYKKRIRTTWSSLLHFYNIWKKKICQPLTWSFHLTEEELKLDRMGSQKWDKRNLSWSCWYAWSDNMIIREVNRWKNTGQSAHLRVTGSAWLRAATSTRKDVTEWSPNPVTSHFIFFRDDLHSDCYLIGKPYVSDRSQARKDPFNPL